MSFLPKIIDDCDTAGEADETASSTISHSSIQSERIFEQRNFDNLVASNSSYHDPSLCNSANGLYDPVSTDPYHDAIYNYTTPSPLEYALFSAPLKPEQHFEDGRDVYTALGKADDSDNVANTRYDEDVMVIDSDNDDLSGQRHFKTAKPYQYKSRWDTYWQISTSDGTLKDLSFDDWSSSTEDISFCAWKPDKLADECIDIWSPTLRCAIRDACPDIYKSKDETCFSLEQVLQNYDRLKNYVTERELYNPADDRVTEELKLFVYVFLQAGGVAKTLGTFGFEKLYEKGTLSLSHWEDIQQAGFERDLDALDMAFDAAEDEAAKDMSVSIPDGSGSTKYPSIFGPYPSLQQPENTPSSRYGGALEDSPYDPGDLLALFQPRDSISRSLYEPSSDKSRFCLICNGFCPIPVTNLGFIKRIKPIEPTSFRLMTPEENQRYKDRCSIENATEILAAVSFKQDTLASSLLAEKGYSGFADRSVELALRQEDFDTARLLISTEFPMTDAVMAGDLRLINLLISYEVDPNDGCHFMQRPFQTAIINGNLEIARYLLKRCNITDLGNLRAPLCLALQKGDLEQAHSILNRPRTLTAHDFKNSSRTMMQVLRQNLRSEHDTFLAASNVTSSVAFSNLGIQLQDYRTLWKMGISAMRRLRKDRPPSDFRQVISLLLVASAMRKTCSIEEFGDYDAFLQDLQRWKYLAVEESRWDLFDELVLCLWGQKMSPVLEDIEDFGKDMDFLRAFAREFVEMSEMSSASTDAVSHEKPGVEQDGISPIPEGAIDHRLSKATSPATLGQDPDLEASTRASKVPMIEHRQRRTLPCTVAAYLRLGAIFAFFVACLLVFREPIAHVQSLEAVQSCELFSSLIETEYVAPMLLNIESPIGLQNCVEEVKRDIQTGSIRTIDELDMRMYDKALSSNSWSPSSLRKALDVGATSLKKAIEPWSLRQRFTKLAMYLGLQPTETSVTSCVKANPTSSIAMDLRILSNALDSQSFPINRSPSIMSLGSIQRSASTISAASGSWGFQQAPLASEAPYSPLMTAISPQVRTPISSQQQERSRKTIAVPRATQQRNRVQKTKQPPRARKPKRIAPELERTCPVCRKEFSSPGNKNRHVKDMQSDINHQGLPQSSSPDSVSFERASYSCRQGCGSRFKQERNLDDHERNRCRYGNGEIAGEE